MKVITKISVQEKNKKRSNIFLDGQYYCSLSNIVVLQNRLKEGQSVEEQTLCDIQQENEFSEAFDLALSYVAKYEKTQKQVLDYLMKKGYTYPVSFKTVEKLVSYGYVNDESFAKRYVEANSKNKGKLLLKRELILKGISEKCADSAVNSISDEYETVFSLAKKYISGKQNDYKTLQKCYRHLLSKGFSFDSVNEAIYKLKDDCDDY